MTPTEPDGPHTELAAAEAWFREDPKRMDFAPITEWSRHLRTIARAYLTRPAAAPADGQAPTDGLVTAARSVVDLMDRTVDMPGVVRDVVDNLRDALTAAPVDDAALRTAADRLLGQLTAVRELATEAIDDRARAATGKGQHTAQEYVEMDGAAALAEHILAALNGPS